MADELPATARIQCITDTRVWADVIGDDGNITTRPLALDEVVNVPRNDVLAYMKKNRHVVEIR